MAVDGGKISFGEKKRAKRGNPKHPNTERELGF